MVGQDDVKVVHFGRKQVHIYHLAGEEKSMCIVDVDCVSLSLGVISGSWSCRCVIS